MGPNLTPSPDYHQRPENIIESEVRHALRHSDYALFRLKNPEARAGAKHIVATVSDTGGCLALTPLLRLLQTDDQCAQLSILTRGLARKALAEMDFLRGGEELTHGNFFGNTLIDRNLELIREISRDHVDALLVSVETEPGPQTFGLLNPSGLLPADKRYLVVEAYDSLGGGFLRHSDNFADAISRLDGVLCNDHIAEAVAKSTLSKLDASLFHVTGTGQLDSLREEDGLALRSSGSVKLRIPPEERALLFLGDISSYEGLASDFNEETFRQVLLACGRAKALNPDLLLAVLLRPHPADPKKEELFRIAESTPVPSGVRILDASSSKLSLAEAVYSADLTVSTTRTEMVKNCLRGLSSAFPAFGESEQGMGASLLESKVDPSVIRELRNSGHCSFCRSPESLAEEISGLVPKSLVGRPDPSSFSLLPSTQSIRKILFGER